MRNAIEFEHAVRYGRAALVLEVPYDETGWRCWWSVSPVQRSATGGWYLSQRAFDLSRVDRLGCIVPKGHQLLSSTHFTDADALLSRLAEIAPPEAFTYAWRDDDFPG